MTIDSRILGACYMPTSNEIGFNEAALEILFKDHFNPLCAYCQFRFGFELDVAKEAVHTGFIRLWENRESISADLSVKAYIYKIVSNICLDMLKHSKVKQMHVKHVLQTSSGSTSLKSFNPSELKQLTNDIDRAVSELPEQMRKIFELSRYEGMKYAEISLLLNISPKTVETQMSRALVKLRQKLADYLPLVAIGVFIFL